jgi:antitoxin PrlF
MTYRHTITTKGQVTIPKDVRKALGLQPGDQAEFRIKPNGEVVVERPKTVDETLREVRHMLGKPTFSEPLSEREKLVGPYLLDKYVKSSRRH